MANPRIRTVIINAVDQDLVVAFWSHVLGAPVAATDDHAGIVWLERPTPDQPNVGIQRVAARVSPHSEVHLDIAVDDLATAQEEIERAGGRCLTRNTLPNGFEWRVCADPEGNELCIYVE